MLVTGYLSIARRERLRQQRRCRRHGLVPVRSYLATTALLVIGITTSIPLALAWTPPAPGLIAQPFRWTTAARGLVVAPTTTTTTLYSINHDGSSPATTARQTLRSGLFAQRQTLASPLPASLLLLQHYIYCRLASMPYVMAAVTNRRRRRRRRDWSPSLLRLLPLRRSLQRGATWFAIILLGCSLAWLPMEPAFASSSSSSSAISVESTSVQQLVPSRTTTTTPSAAAAAASSASLDALIDRYVHQHMFDDDLTTVLDPVAATYQEVHDDATTGRHVSALRQIVSSVLGQTATRTTTVSNVVDNTSGGLGPMLISLVRGLQQRTGWSEAFVTVSLAAIVVVAGPVLFLVAGVMVGNVSKRNMDQLFKKRYGDTYTVDATAKQEPILEAPPDEDDDEDDSDDTDDTDDDEEDEDTKKDSKGKK
jgi:hypothetical protein